MDIHGVFRIYGIDIDISERIFSCAQSLRTGISSRSRHQAAYCDLHSQRDLSRWIHCLPQHFVLHWDCWIRKKSARHELLNWPPITLMIPLIFTPPPKKKGTIQKQANTIAETSRFFRGLIFQGPTGACDIEYHPGLIHLRNLPMKFAQKVTVKAHRWRVVENCCSMKIAVSWLIGGGDPYHVSCQYAKKESLRSPGWTGQ